MSVILVDNWTRFLLNALADLKLHSIPENKHSLNIHLLIFFPTWFHALIIPVVRLIMNDIFTFVVSFQYGNYFRWLTKHRIYTLTIWSGRWNCEDFFESVHESSKLFSVIIVLTILVSTLRKTQYLYIFDCVMHILLLIREISILYLNCDAISTHKHYIYISMITVIMQKISIIHFFFYYTLFKCI